MSARKQAQESLQDRLAAAGRIMRAERATASQRQQAAADWQLLDALPPGSTLRKITEARSLGLTAEVIAARTGLAAEDIADIHAIGLALIAAAEAAG